MKHCPNPECPGIENFKAISEFNDTALSCSDCGKALVYGPAPSLEERKAVTAPVMETEVELVPVFIVEDEAELMLVQSIMNQSGIPYLAKGENLQHLFGFGGWKAVSPLTGPVEIHVRMDDAEAARNILAETLDEDSGQ
jgi:hypothetical protein